MYDLGLFTKTKETALLFLTSSRPKLIELGEGILKELSEYVDLIKHYLSVKKVRSFFLSTLWSRQPKKAMSLIWKHGLLLSEDLIFALLEASNSIGDKAFFYNVLSFFQDQIREASSPVQATLDGYFSKYRDQWGVVVTMEGI